MWTKIGDRHFNLNNLVSIVAVEMTWIRCRWGDGEDGRLDINFKDQQTRDDELNRILKLVYGPNYVD